MIENTKHSNLVGWTPYQLSDIYTERREPGNDTLPMLTVSIHDGVSDGELDDDELGKKVRRIADKTQYRVAKPGDLVFNMMRAWQGAIGVARSEGMVSPAYIVAKPNDKVYPLFMDYYMKTPRMVGIINRQSYGVTDFRKRLYWDSFAPIGVTLPPIAEQKKIAAILTTQDKVIELKEKRLAEKQRQKKYLMQQLLTGKKRLDGFAGEWQYKKLCDICHVIGGGTPDTNNVSFWNGNIPWISSSDLEMDNFHAITKTRFITEYAINQSATKRCPKDTILLVSRVGIGKVAIADEELCTSQDFTNIIQTDNNNNYIAYSLYWIIHEKSAQVQGTAIKGLQVKEIKQYIIPLPSIDEQNAIAKALSTADNEIMLLQQDLDQEKQKKKALMQLLLTGKVRVNI